FYCSTQALYFPAQACAVLCLSVNRSGSPHFLADPLVVPGQGFPLSGVSGRLRNACLLALFASSATNLAFRVVYLHHFKFENACHKASRRARNFSLKVEFSWNQCNRWAPLPGVPREILQRI